MKELIPDLIAALGDVEDLVVRAAQVGLGQLIAQRKLIHPCFPGLKSVGA